MAVDEDGWISDENTYTPPPVFDVPAPSRNRRPPRTAKHSSTFSIGKTDVGRLIGRGGSTIKDLRQKSGCEIDIGDEDRREVAITVYGPSDDACKAAQEMIEEHLGYNKGFHVSKGDDDYVIDWAAAQAQHEESEKQRWAKCPPLVKNFYYEHPEVTAMADSEVIKFREDNNNIVISNFDPESGALLMNPVPRFTHAFEKFPEIMNTIERWVSV